MPGRRAKTLEAVQEFERLGFSGVYSPSMADCMGFCQSVAHVTNEIQIGTSIQPIYYRHPAELARAAAYINEISDGRFRLGIGVSHGPMLERHHLSAGKPLTDIRNYVADMRAAEKETGPLPPITLATLRDKMLGLAVEIAEGAVWANGARSHMATQLKAVSEEKRKQGFFVGDMIPTVIDDDEQAAAAVNRKTLIGYIQLPNYRNYWKAAGYVQEMEDAEKAIASGEPGDLTRFMTDKWLSDNTLYGSVSKVRDGVEAWFDAGISTPILVPSSTSGGQMKAIEELMNAFK